MNITKTKLPGVLIVEPKIFRDSRGFFKESFQENTYNEIGIDYKFVQDNHSHSVKGVLRGLHFQKKNPQGKLVSCLKGAVYDVIVDINLNSKTFGKYLGVKLTGNNHKQIWIPPGFAHGFCVLSETADFIYKCTNHYDPDDEGGLLWNDPDIGIDWPIDQPILSEKDKVFPTLTELTTNVLKL